MVVEKDSGLYLSFAIVRHENLLSPCLYGIIVKTYVIASYFVPIIFFAPFVKKFVGFSLVTYQIGDAELYAPQV